MATVTQQKKLAVRHCKVHVLNLLPQLALTTHLLGRQENGISNPLVSARSTSTNIVLTPNAKFILIGLGEGTAELPECCFYFFLHYSVAPGIINVILQNVLISEYSESDR